MSLSTIIALCKRRGFIFPGSELYGGLAGTFDYGPLGCQMKMNLKSEWWKYFVTKRPKECIGLDTGILLSPKVWENSGHVSNFSDPLSECLECKKRTRSDHHVESLLNGKLKKGKKILGGSKDLTKDKKKIQNLWKKSKTSPNWKIKH
jgi:glycyl-tRNA synthetase